MSGYGRILIVDDDPAFLEAYNDLLSDAGYRVVTATTHADALRLLDKPGWSIVLVDQKLQGPGGPDLGLDLITQARQRAPGAKVLLVTAYASKEAIERAFREGAYDYLEKTSVFGTMLQVKVRNAMEAVRERWLGTLDPDGTERAIQSTWEEVQTEQDRNRKGVLLEQLVALIFRTIPGFERLDLRLRNDIEELDLLVQNSSLDPFWQKESPYLLVECKNWSKHVGTKELRDLWGKLDGRYDRCRLALFIAPGGFAETVQTQQLQRARENKLVILIGPGDLDELVRRKDRSEVLKEMHRRAVVATVEGSGSEGS
ncbi:response regulator [Chondromyces apiculatus]|uniref:Sigma-54 dependent transcriptional regulator n=1 Tax=Chondromyces apiculatus DSM 436 TaxID=1192034 RepID=A0A017THU9_9BACT|nr:response regulator [Chondromyces apiculatus]EYF08829.1 sigma-54 dependent transcriptional regulator [Chondromyces apiculatus DSM 436]